MRKVRIQNRDTAYLNLQDKLGYFKRRSIFENKFNDYDRNRAIPFFKMIISRIIKMKHLSHYNLTFVKLCRNQRENYKGSR